MTVTGGESGLRRGAESSPLKLSVSISERRADPEPEGLLGLGEVKERVSLSPP